MTAPSETLWKWHFLLDGDFTGQLPVCREFQWLNHNPLKLGVYKGHSTWSLTRYIAKVFFIPLLGLCGRTTKDLKINVLSYTRWKLLLFAWFCKLGYKSLYRKNQRIFICKWARDFWGGTFLPGDYIDNCPFILEVKVYPPKYTLMVAFNGTSEYFDRK